MTPIGKVTPVCAKTSQLFVLLFVISMLGMACGGGDFPVDVTVQGHGMDDTLQDGQSVKALDYDGRAPARGDVILFAAPLTPDRWFIKRVIGVPGDEIEIDQRRETILVNGKRLDEPYAKGITGCSQVCSWTIPPANGIVADRVSKDSFRPIPWSTPPADPCGVGCYFVLGDNRQNSSDSRQGWMVPAENIIGYIEVNSAS